ncbi:putative tetratricopeptide repeat domain protein, partial [Vibrio parahaemolyticus V-223/04]
KTKVCQPT